MSILFAPNGFAMITHKDNSFRIDRRRSFAGVPSSITRLGNSVQLVCKRVHRHTYLTRFNGRNSMILHLLIRLSSGSFPNHDTLLLHTNEIHFFNIRSIFNSVSTLLRTFLLLSGHLVIRLRFNSTLTTFFPLNNSPSFTSTASRLRTPIRHPITFTVKFRLSPKIVNIFQVGRGCLTRAQRSARTGRRTNRNNMPFTISSMRTNGKASNSQLQRRDQPERTRLFRLFRRTHQH